MDYHNFNQVMTPITATTPDTKPLLEQISTSPGVWYAAIDLPNAFVFVFVFLNPYLLVKTTRSSLFSASKASNSPSVSYLRDKSALHPYVIIRFEGILIAFPSHKTSR